MHFDRADQVFHHWASKYLGDARVPAELEHSFAFEIIDETANSVGKRWVFSPGPPPRVSEGEGRAECTVLASNRTLLELANGELNPQVAYLSGAIKLSGHIENALKLHALFGDRE